MVTRDSFDRRDDQTSPMTTGTTGTGSSTVAGGITSSGTAGASFDSGLTDSGVSSTSDMTSTTYTPPTGSGSESGGAKDKAMDAASQAKDKASNLAGTAKEKLGGASQTVDQQRDTVAGGLDTVATTLRERADTLPGGDKTTQIAQTAAQKLDSASGYLRQNEVSDMMTDLESFVRAHPTQSLIAGLATGFLVGRMFKG